MHNTRVRQYTEVMIETGSTVSIEIGQLNHQRLHNISEIPIERSKVKSFHKEQTKIKLVCKILQNKIKIYKILWFQLCFKNIGAN